MGQGAERAPCPDSSKMTVSVDFETYYSKEYSVADLDVYGYTHHPEFDPYLVSIVSSGGQEFCGDPRDFDWPSIAQAQWVSHNRSFDKGVFVAALEQGLWKGALPTQWDCTADLTAFLGLPRSLDKANLYLYGVPVDKSPRAYMKGRKWATVPDAKHQELVAYCLQDSRYCLRIWQDHQHKWPESERWVSRHTTEMGWRGVPVNREAIDQAITDLRALVFEALQIIPWADSDEDKPQAIAGFAKFCRTKGVEPPASVAMDSEECEAWMKTHRGSAPECVRLLEAQRVYRRANMLLKKLLSMRVRVKPDGYMSYSLKYGGAHTLRDSGDGGVNLQNLPRNEMELGMTREDGTRVQASTDLRGVIEAPPGFVFISSDLSQIEPRVLRWLVNDQKTLGYLRQGFDPYEAFARSVLGYSDPRPLKDVDKELRAICKVSELSLGYGVGWQTFQRAMAVEGVEVSDVKAKEAVMLYRARNMPVLALGNRMLQDMKASHGGDYHIELPSGRKLHYWMVDAQNGIKAKVPKFGNLEETGWFGGKLVENLVQAVARDVFMECVYLVEGLNLPVLMRVHDEVLVLSPEDIAETNRKWVEAAMSTPPAWAKSLPVAAEAKIIRRYEK